MIESTNNTVWKLIDDLANKQGITEIVINNPQTVFVEREGNFIQLNVSLKPEDVTTFVEEVAQYNQKKCNKDFPILDGNLPDGSRVNIVTGPLVKTSPVITIRKYLKRIKSFDSDQTIFGLDSFWVGFLKACVQARLNIVVSGGTGVGKTTFLNLLLQEILPEERVVTIEDTMELSIDIPNLVRLESRGYTTDSKASVSVRDLVKNTLRMRPDRIIIGEVRGEEMFDLLQALNTGHEGSMTSVHANSPGECISRMETLYLLSGYDVPIGVMRKQISTAIDFIIQISRDRNGKRFVSHISEITGMEVDVVQMQHIALVDNDRLSRTAMVPTMMNKLHDQGGLPMDFFS